jgi:hypothetical protein
LVISSTKTFLITLIEFLPKYTLARPSNYTSPPPAPYALPPPQSYPSQPYQSPVDSLGRDLANLSFKASTTPIHLHLINPLTMLLPLSALLKKHLLHRLLLRP